MTREEIKELKKGDYVEVVEATYPLPLIIIGEIFKVSEIIYIHDEKFTNPSSIYVAVINNNNNIININGGVLKKYQK